MPTRAKPSMRLRIIEASVKTRRGPVFALAQAMVEFALIAPLVLLLLLVGVQFAIIGAAALGLGQANYQAARYAA